MALENKLCFKIYSASRIIVRMYKPILDKINLTFPQYIVMLTLWEQDKISFKDLGQILMFETGTLTPILQKLEKAGYINRIRSSDDERKVFIELTDLGKELKNKAECVPNDILKSVGITKEEYNEYLKNTSELFEVLNKAEKRY